MTINLLEKIEKLLIEIPKTNSVSPIVEGIYADLKRNYPTNTYGLLESYNSIMTKLQNYDFIAEIDGFIKEGLEFFQENNLHIKSIIALNNMQNSRQSSYYEKAVNELAVVLESNDESTIAKSILENLKDYTWIAEIKELNRLANIIEKGLNESNFKYSVKPVFSPIIPVRESKDNESYIFYNNGRLLKINEESIEPTQVSTVNGLFRTLCEAVDRFSIKNNTVSTSFFGSKVEIVKENENVKILLDSNEVNKEHLTDYFMNSSGWLAKNKKDVALIEAVSEQFDAIVEMEIGKKVISTINEGISLSVFKHNGKVYLQKVNAIIGINEFNEYSVDEAVKTAKEYIGIDLRPMLSDLLESKEAEMVALVEEYKSLQGQSGALSIRKDKFVTEAVSNGILNESSVQEAISKIDLMLEKNSARLTELESVIGNDNNVLMEGFINTALGQKTVQFYAHEYMSEKNLINIKLDGHMTLINKKDINVKN